MMENLTRLLLENVLPAHVAPEFIGQKRRNEVNADPRCPGLQMLWDPVQIKAETLHSNSLDLPHPPTHHGTQEAASASALVGYSVFPRPQALSQGCCVSRLLLKGVFFPFSI